MTVCLEILSPGPGTTIQDLGRPGYQRFGIPVCGALDTFSLRAANTLVGNAPDVGALEIAYRGPVFRVSACAARVAFFGARARITLRRNGGSTRLSVGRSHRLIRGDEVDVGALAGSATLYAAVEGGFAIPPVLGGISTYVRGGVGGWNGRALKSGDCPPLALNWAEERDEFSFDTIEPCPTSFLRVVDGPQVDHFGHAEIEAFYSGSYLIGSGADRMGARLSGPALRPLRGHDIVSDGVRPGSIQIPGDGQPIVLRCEHQTTGGYPKIATVITADWSALGRLATGDRIRFQRVTMDEAEAARRAYALAVESLPRRVKPVPAYELDLETRLWAANLVSGVCDAYCDLG